MSIPPHIKQAIDLHVTEGRATGFFVKAVLENDLFQAIGHADPESQACLRDIVIYCHNYIPSNCWGSKEAVKEWIKKGGDPDGLKNAS